MNASAAPAFEKPEKLPYVNPTTDIFPAVSAAIPLVTSVSEVPNSLVQTSAPLLVYLRTNVSSLQEFTKPGKPPFVEPEI